MTSSTKTRQRQVIVDPAFALEWRDVDDFLNEFGPYSGRYVPSYPSDWVQRLRAHLRELDIPPVKRNGLETKISSQARLCTVAQNWEWDDSKVWKDNLRKLAIQLNDSLVVGYALDPQPFHSWQDVIDEIRASRARSWVFNGTVREYQELCTPLLLASPAAYLIDPYLDPFEFETELLLRSMFDKMKGSRCYSLEVIKRWPVMDFSDKKGHANFDEFDKIESELIRQYEDLVPKGGAFKLHFVLEAKDGNALRLHDRFFLTKYGAINFGHGFRIVGKGQPQQNAFVVDAEHHNYLKQTYIQGVAHFKEQQPQVRDVPLPRDVVTLTVRSHGS